MHIKVESLLNFKFGVLSNKTKLQINTYTTNSV